MTRINELEAENEKLQDELRSILSKIAEDEIEIKKMKLNPASVINDLVSVQPMTSPVGKAFSMKYVIKEEEDESK